MLLLLMAWLYSGAALALVTLQVIPRAKKECKVYAFG